MEVFPFSFCIMGNCFPSPSLRGLLSINCISPVGKYSTRLHTPKVQSRTTLPFPFFLAACILGPWGLTDHLTWWEPTSASLHSCTPWWVSLHAFSWDLPTKVTRMWEAGDAANEWHSNALCSERSCCKAHCLLTSSEYSPVVEIHVGSFHVSITITHGMSRLSGLNHSRSTGGRLRLSGAGDKLSASVQISACSRRAAKPSKWASPWCFCSLYSSSKISWEVH